VPEAATVRDLVNRHRRRLMILLRALVPSAVDAETAWRETLIRIGKRAGAAPKDDFGNWADEIAREVAAELRRIITPLPFSDDLFRQLADSATRSVDVANRRPKALAEIIERLPPPEKDLLRRKYALQMTTDQISVTEGRPAAAVARDLMLLQGTLVSTLQEALPDGGPASPGGASDLGRMTDQLLNGTITDDGRLVLETLLLADAAAQAHYLRHVALAVELAWKYRGEPELPVVPTDRRRLTPREWVMTIAFVCACVAAAAFIALLFTGQLKTWW
jgi:DNA-directed RNA polymerase specialized sigma24 family protein